MRSSTKRNVRSLVRSASTSLPVLAKSSLLQDETANPATLATDMLAQAEHDVRTRVGLVTTDRKVAEETIKEVEEAA